MTYELYKVEENQTRYYTCCIGNSYAFLALIALPLFFRASARARSWLESWNAREADRRQLAYALLPVNALTIGIHLVTGLSLGVAYALAPP